VLFFSIPAVQTRLGKYATNRINSDFGTNINIKRVGLQFNGDVELKDIYIEDYKKDTLIGIQELNTSIVNFRNLYKNKLAFGDIDIIGLTFNIKTYKGAKKTNLDIFVEKFEDDKPQTEKSGFLLSSSDVSIYDSTFRLIDYNHENPQSLEFKDLNINATNFLINASDVSTRINTLSFKDSRGLVINNMVTDFEYTLKYMDFKNLRINTQNSTLKGHLRFDYNREDLQFFTDKVNVTAQFEDSQILLDELNTLYNEFGTNQKVTLKNVNLSGTLNDLMANELMLTTNSNTSIYGDINFKNMFNAQADNFVMDGKFSKLSSNYYDLKALLPNILGESIPSMFSNLGNFSMIGTSYITSKQINANLDIITEIGLINSNLSMNNVDNIDNASYKGNIIFEDFNLGKLINNPLLGNTSLNLDVNGKGFTTNNLNTNIEGDIFSLNYNDYTYQKIKVSGQLGNNIFNGVLNSMDDNFKFKFDGLADLSNEIKALDFIAQVDYANLKALNFVSKDSLSIFKGNVKMSMKGKNIDDAIGYLYFNNTSYINQNDKYYFQDFTITSTFQDDERTININSPDIIEGKIKGKFLFRDIPKLIENSVGSLYTNYIPNKVAPNQYIDFKFKIYNKIVEAFYHDLKLSPNTVVKGHLESDDKGFKLNFNSPQIKLFQYFADNIELTVDNSNPLFNTFIEIDSLNTKFYNVSDFSLINVTQRDTLFIKSQFNGGKRNNDDFNLNLFYTINPNNKSVVGFRKSNITFKENTWTINNNKDTLNKVVFDRTFKEIDIKPFVANHYNETISLQGQVKDADHKNLTLNFTDVDLTKITPSIDSLKLEGNINGQLSLIQKDGTYLPTSHITISDFKANDYELGQLNAKILGNKSLTDYNLDIKILNDNIKSFDAVGSIDLDKSNIDIDVIFEEFLLDPLEPLGEGVITNIRGFVSGDAKVSGNLKKPSIDGKLYLDNAGLSIPYLNVDYGFDFDSEVELSNQQFVFNNVILTDSEYFSQATLNGMIKHNNFSNWILDLDISTDRLLVLNTDDSEEALYYGTAFVNGQANISGPTDELTIGFEGRTEKGTIFKVPLNDLETYGDNSYIHFLSPEEKKARQKGEEYISSPIKGVELDFDLFVTPNADIEIVIDRDSGSTIQGTGNGNLLFQINTNGKFKMWGDFVVTKGFYNFAYGGLIQKKLTVEPGGSIRWEGDPMQAQIGLTAIYETNANPSVLLDNPINRSIPVNVEISLAGQLEQPEPEFNFTFPNVSSTIKSELEYRLETKESRERQALNLLTFGSFASDLNIGQQAYGTIADRVNSLINSIISNDNEKINWGVDIQPGEQTPDYQTDDRLGLTLSTKISDRVLFNGKVGVPIGGVSQTVIAGDAEIQVLLNEDGSLSAKFFNRENSIRNFGEEIGYTQGIGLSYNVEFDTFKEFLQIILSGKNKKDNNSQKSQNIKKDENGLLPDYIKIKPKTDSKQ